MLDEKSVIWIFENLLEKAINLKPIWSVGNEEYNKFGWENVTGYLPTYQKIQTIM